MEANALTPAAMKHGGRYNWKGQPDRLIYLGRNWSGNGYWHQFKKIGDPREVWCEVVDADLPGLEETSEPADHQSADALDAARYRWLRSADNDVAPLIKPSMIGWQMLVGSRLDAAIDAAMAKEST